MREATRWSARYQTGNLFLVHLEGIGITFLFSILFMSMLSTPVIKELLSAIFILIYFGLIYSRAHKFAVNDKKDYSPTKPSILKAAVMGGVISFSVFVGLFIYKLVWIYTAVDGVLVSAPAWIYSLFFWIYTIPYSGIMGLSHGNMMIYSQILMIIVPIAASVSGYTAGIKGISIADKLAGLVYEKKD